MKTLVEYLNETQISEDLIISDELFKDSVADYNGMRRYYKATGKKVGARDSKKLLKAQQRINMYLDQHGIRRMDWWMNNEFAG